MNDQNRHSDQRSVHSMSRRDVVVRAGGDVEPDRLADVIRAVRKA